MLPTFLVDENLSPLLIFKFRQLGYQAVSVREIGLQGKDDSSIAQWAKEHKTIIVTGDRDFGELWYWYYAGKLGVIILRLNSQSLEGQEKILDYLHKTDLFKHPSLSQALIISSEDHHRIRVIQSNTP